MKIWGEEIPDSGEFSYHPTPGAQVGNVSDPFYLRGLRAGVTVISGIVGFAGARKCAVCGAYGLLAEPGGFAPRHTTQGFGFESGG